MERTWIIVAFGDIRGFGAWTSRAANTPEVKEPFIEDFYASLQVYVDKYRDLHFKYLGDGFMVAKELDHKDSRGVYEFLKKIKLITKQSILTIRKCGYPQPSGFRIRIACGDVYKMMVIDSNDPQRKRSIPEYLDYATNKAAHLLNISPEIPCLVTENVVNALGKYRSVFRLRKLVKPSHYPESVNKVDIDGLQVLEF